MEEWKKFENYEVSNFGNIMTKTGKLKKPCLTHNGYYRVGLAINNKTVKYFVHVLVALLFIGEKPENNQVDHIDRNRINNKIENLRYVSPSQNQHNRNDFRHDITETDLYKRKLIYTKEYNEKKRRQLGMKIIKARLSLVEDKVV